VRHCIKEKNKHYKHNMNKKIGLLLLLSLIVMSSCKEKQEEREKAPTRVSTEVVEATGTAGNHTYVGIVEENEGTAVSFTSMGAVRHVYVNEGQMVRRGQLIAEIDDTQARNMVSAAEAQMAQANDALQRYGMLHDNGSLPESQWVEIQSKVAQAKSSLEVARKNLADCKLTAPVSGIIGKKNISTGETAMPSQAVVTILDISTVKVKVSIPENEMNRLSSRTPSTIRVAAVNEMVSGGMIEKGIQADALTHTYEVRIRVHNGNHHLLPGMVADVTFHNGGAEGGTALTLPVTSVQKNAGGGLFVWTVDDSGKAHRTPVDIGRTAGNRVVVAGGLQAGQRVVVEGYQKLSEGTQVVY